MTRASRVPLGHAAKAWKTVGEADIYGHVIADGEEGWFYLWHRGLQMLGGKESLDANLYQQRPSFESDLCKGCTWKKDFRAAIQLPPGHQDDPTFDDLDLEDFASKTAAPSASKTAASAAPKKTATGASKKAATGASKKAATGASKKRGGRKH